MMTHLLQRSQFSRKPADKNSTAYLGPRANMAPRLLLKLSCTVPIPQTPALRHNMHYGSIAAPLPNKLPRTFLYTGVLCMLCT